MKPYQDNQTGVWNGLPEVKTRTEFIEATLFDNDGNAYPATVEIEVNNFVVEVVGVMKQDGKVLLNNPMDDIKDAIRNAGYRSREIKF